MPVKSQQLVDAKSIKSRAAKPLGDSLIREALVLRLASQSPKPRAIIQELRVHNGNAIADIVALHSEAHCYEIKGCNDKVVRLLTQGEYYNKAFRRITLVTTDRNLACALRIAPEYWGIMVARRTAGMVRLRYARKAGLNPNFNGELAALTLWKSEMLQLVEEKRMQSKPRAYLAQLIAESKENIELSTTICDLLVMRQSGSNDTAKSHI